MTLTASLAVCIAQAVSWMTIRFTGSCTHMITKEALPRYFSQRKRHSCESAQIKAIPQAAAR